MAKLAAGGSVTVNLHAGQTLSLSGSAEVFGVGAPQVVNGDARFGPYQIDVSLIIKAISTVLYSENYIEEAFTAEHLISEDGAKIAGYKNPDGTYMTLAGLCTKSPGVIACAGDSIADINYFRSGSPGLSERKSSRGQLNWFLAFAGQPLDFQFIDDFALSGSTTEHFLNVQVPQILSAKSDGRNYQFCFVSSGTNDFTVSALKADGTLRNLAQAFEELNAAGITPIHTGIRPRGADGSIQQYKQEARTVSKGLQLLENAGLCIYVDCTEVYADNSTAFGNALSTMTYDNLHPNTSGAMLEGKTLWQNLAGKFQVGLKTATSQDDVFDRDKNPFGCIGSIAAGVITANPLLQGGTTAPTGMATAGGTWSKVNRTLANAQVRTDARVTLAASTTHTITIDCIGSGAFTATQLQPGDILEGACVIKLGNGTSAAGISQINFQVITNDGTTSWDYNELSNGGDTGAIPFVGNELLYLRTPQAEVKPYSGSGNHYVRTRLTIITTAAGAGTVDVMALECRPIRLAGQSALA